MTFRLLPEEHIINSMSKVYESYFSRQNNLSKIIEDETKAVKKIGAFFQVSETTAIITAILWCNQVKGNRFQLNKYMKKLKLDTLTILNCNEELSGFKKKAWLIPSKRRHEINNTDDYIFSKEFMYAVTINKPEELQIKIADDFFSAMIQMHRYIKNINDSLEFHSSGAIILEYLEKLKTVEPISLLFENSKIEPMERVLLAYLIGAYVAGEGSFDLNYCLDYIDRDGEFHYQFKDRVIKGHSVLFTQGYLIFYTDGFVDFSEVKLGSRITDKINQHLITTKVASYSPKLLEVKNPDDLKKVNLFFNPNLETEIKNIFKATSSQFEVIEEKLVQQKTSGGLTFLFYGSSGTGKTEIVKQLAKENKRTILSVDFSKIISKHIGESEKNVKMIFHEYREFKKISKSTPILLLNEADALISKRNNVEKAVDQMYNCLQNILLQELEDFEGLFIATTNRLDNIDTAFDRRFIYKVHFEEPNKDTRLRILCDAFPNENYHDLLLPLNNQYCLNGGQILAIKKRVLVQNIILKKKPLSSELLDKLAKEQIEYRNIRQVKVGF